MGEFHHHLYGPDGVDYTFPNTAAGEVVAISELHFLIYDRLRRTADLGKLLWYGQYEIRPSYDGHATGSAYAFQFEQYGRAEFRLELHPTSSCR